MPLYGADVSSTHWLKARITVTKNATPLLLHAGRSRMPVVDGIAHLDAGAVFKGMSRSLKQKFERRTALPRGEEPAVRASKVRNWRIAKIT